MIQIQVVIGPGQKNQENTSLQNYQKIVFNRTFINYIYIQS